MACEVQIKTSTVLIVLICVCRSTAINVLDAAPDYKRNLFETARDMMNVIEIFLETSTRSDTYYNLYNYDNFVNWLSPSQILQNILSMYNDSEFKGFSGFSNFTNKRVKREATGRFSLPSNFKESKRSAKRLEERGRKMKLQKTLVKMVLALKVLTLGLVLPGVVALSMLHSWKAVTISLLAFGLALILGIKNIVKAISGWSNHKSPPPQMVHTAWPTYKNHQYFWKTIKLQPETPIAIADEDHHHDLSSHELAYRKHYSR